MKILHGMRRTWGACESALRGHSRVNSVVFSPDGSRIASASHDGTVRIWNAMTGEFEAVLEGHSENVTSVVFSPDGMHIASVSHDDTARIWHTMTGKAEAVLREHLAWETSVNFSPDGSSVAFA